MSRKNIPKTKASRKLPQRFLQQTILKFLRSKPDKTFSARLISQKIKTKNSIDSIQSSLDKLVDRKKVIKSVNGKYRYHSNGNKGYNKSQVTLVGKIDIINSGAGFVLVAGQSRDVFVPAHSINSAMNGDTVKIQLTKEGYGGRRPEGRVIEIIKRLRTTFIGKIKHRKHYSTIYVYEGHYDFEVAVKTKDIGDAADEDIVVVEITQFGDGASKAIKGRVTQVLNYNNRNDFEMNSILINNGFDLIFSPEVLAETDELNDNITHKDVEERLDLREKMIFTIDPIDAKDFDDALSYEVLNDGAVQIGIHIADVTHFVQENTALDKEAYARSTSVYLVDRVCPMLPERISNELCSLRPHENKFSFSALFTFDENNNLTDEWFGKTLIHSKHRFTYEEAQKVLDEKKGTFAEELAELNRMAHYLRGKRFEEGSIDFESDEVRFEMDENGVPTNIIRKLRGDSHKLVEEFMLLANRRVARYIAKKTKNPPAFVYRVHDIPDPDRLVELAMLASEFGIKLQLDTPRQIATSLNNLTKQAADQELLSILRPMAIRTMAKAVYSTNNIGHYGLGFEYYSHFTSPIRRYSDVLTHRILQRNLEADYRLKPSDLEEKCLHISSQERAAINAERDSIKFKQVEYLSSHIGSVMSGVIRNIVDKGMFIELIESQADGLLRFDQFDESFTLHPAKIKAIGRDTGRVLRIGDPINVLLLDVDMEKKQIEFGVGDEL